MYLFNALPWVVPLGLIGTALGLGLLPVGRRSMPLSDRLLRALLIGWAFVIIGAVIAPGPFYIPENTLRYCGLDEFPLPHFGLEFGHRMMNQILFAVPGVLAGGLSNSRWKWLTVGILALAPPVIEFTQWLLPLLARSCQLEDLSDNWFGLAVGLATGTVVRVLVAKWLLHRRLSASTQTTPRSVGQ